MDDGIPPGDVTRLLREWRDGREAARDEALELVYRHLRLIAGRYLSHERRGHTLQATDLVHEAYLRLANQDRTDWRNRDHFFAIASQAMRRALLDHARRGLAAKRIGPSDKLSLTSVDEPAAENAVDLLDLDAALGKLERLDPRQARLVELRYFCGLTIEDTASVLEISPASVKREWRLAQAWLRREMSG